MLEIYQNDEFIQNTIPKLILRVDSFINDIPFTEVHSLNRRLKKYNSKLKEDLNLFNSHNSNSKKLKYLINIFASLNAIEGYLEFVESFCGLDTKSCCDEIQNIKNRLFDNNPRFSSFILSNNYPTINPKSV